MRKDYALTPEQKVDARTALRELGDSKLTLQDCVRLAKAMHGTTAGATKTPAGVAADKFLASVLARGKRAATFSFYEAKLKPYLAWMQGAAIDSVERPTLKAWLESLSCGDTQKRMHFRAIRAMYRWATRQDPPLTSRDPTAGLRLETNGGTKKEPKFYSVEECERMLRGVPPSILPALALSLFAGIRPEELYPVEPTKARLDWQHVREKIIRVPAEVAKTGRGRIIEAGPRGLPPTFWAWIKSHHNGAGPACTASYKTAQGEIKAALGGDWINDGLRHTFISYVVAFTGDTARVSMWAGHEGRTSLIHNNYAGLTDKATAARFLALRP